ncbi:FAD-dependent monooxygenase [Leptospira sarikeiensis]|uniref:FAD-dependent oxidoreductase n=1 Tax=Leptospira sarikeiensis TaxID=2484943 RepID=A0A4R9KAR8_9LEPT|nr:FAD-dependent monooxygenase [Leptospira sarikeiensis]TGL63794.1 FAD-dependent oxidoreductase [Leptospira sarikeiensis]
MNNNQNKPIYDVIISGAGPVGLFLGCELALAKCKVLILEKAEDPNSILKQIPFGIRGLSSPTIEALYRRGLLDEFEIHKRMKSPHQNSGQGGQRQVGHFAGIPFHEGNIKHSEWMYRLSSSNETNLISEMLEIETILSRRAKTLGVEVKRGFAITDFQQTENEVTVQSNDLSFECKWLVGCDGARSIVRKLGGFTFDGTEPEFTGYSTKVDIADPEKLGSGRVVTPKGMYLQSQPGYVIIQDFDGGAFHSSEKQITLEHVQDVLRKVSNTDVTISALHAATSWTDRARQATNYRNGRVFLAGDAAHIHSPLGGQGLNLGIGDAMNLGWKLSSAIRNKAPEGLLDSYYAERYPIGEKVLDWSRAQVSIMRPDPYGRAMNSIIRDLMDTKDGATYFAGRVWGIHTHYDLGEGHPLLGHSVPNFELEDGTKIGTHMREGHGLLLEFGGSTSLKNLASEYRSQLEYVNGRPKEDLGIRAVLVRPDGYIAWISGSEPDERSIRLAVNLWFSQDAKKTTESLT